MNARVHSQKRFNFIWFWITRININEITSQNKTIPSLRAPEYEVHFRNQPPNDCGHIFMFCIIKLQMPNCTKWDGLRNEHEHYSTPQNTTLRFNQPIIKMAIRQSDKWNHQIKATIAIALIECFTLTWLADNFGLYREMLIKANRYRSRVQRLVFIFFLLNF